MSNNLKIIMLNCCPIALKGKETLDPFVTNIDV